MNFPFYLTYILFFLFGLWEVTRLSLTLVASFALILLTCILIMTFFHLFCDSYFVFAPIIIMVKSILNHRLTSNSNIINFCCVITLNF